MSSLSAALSIVMLLVILNPENSAADQLRRPWITKQPATVLDLQCGVPWVAVEDAYRLDIGFGDPMCDQCVCAYYVLTHGHQVLNFPGQRNHAMAVANVAEQNGHVLSIRMPIVKLDVGQYFCLIHYTTGSTPISYSVHVGESFLDEPRELWNGSFFVKTSRADNVIVTWSISNPSESIDIKIDRVHFGLDIDGKGTTYSTFLVSTNNDQVLHKESSTLLAKVLPSKDQQNGNYSVWIYAQSEFCFSNCSYQCRSSITCSDKVCSCEGMSVPHLQSNQCSYRYYIIGMGVGFPVLILIAFILGCQHKRCVSVRKKMNTCCCKCKDPPPDERSRDTPTNMCDRNIQTNMRDRSIQTNMRDRITPPNMRDRNFPRNRHDRNTTNPPPRRATSLPRLPTNCTEQLSQNARLKELGLSVFADDSQSCDFSVNGLGDGAIGGTDPQQDGVGTPLLLETPV